MKGDAFRRHFEIPGRPVAVKLLKEEINVGEATEGSFRYCEAVKLASAGQRIVLNEINLSCSGAEVSLGLIEPLFEEEGEESGEIIKTVIIEPYTGQDCDAVLVVVTPEKAMKIGSTYAQLFNEPVSARFSGENAVCGEATREVIDSGKPNVSFLCEGAREYGGYAKDEIVIGFPVEIFRKMDEAIAKEQIRALCGCLMDDLPKRVIEKFEEMGFDKATDHFMGMHNGKVVKLYVMKGEKLSGVAVFTSVKFKSEDEAEKVVGSYSGSGLLYRRENWVDVSKIIEFDDLERAIREPDFERRLLDVIEEVIREAKDLKALTKIV